METMPYDVEAFGVPNLSEEQLLLVWHSNYWGLAWLQVYDLAIHCAHCTNSV